MYVTMDNAPNFEPRMIPESRLKKNCILNGGNGGGNGILRTVPAAAMNATKRADNVKFKTSFLKKLPHFCTKN